MLAGLTGLLGGGNGGGGAYESIASYAPSTGTSTITFSGISQTYKHLQLRVLAKGNLNINGSSSLEMRLNGDSGSNYTWHSLSGDATSAAANGTTGIPGFTNFDMNLNGSSFTNVFSSYIIDLHDYSSSSKYKTMRDFNGYNNNTTDAGYVTLASGLWLNTSAITTVTFSFSAGFVSGSSFALYGIKG